MEPVGGIEVRSGSCGVKGAGIGDAEYQMTMADGAPPVSGNSFTALLELPPSQAVELLHCAGAGESPSDLPGNVLNRHRISHQNPYNHTLNCSPAFPSNAALVERAAKYSVFATGGPSGGGGGIEGLDWSKTSPNPNISGSALKVKSEPADCYSNPNSTSEVSDPTFLSQSEKATKRKERENRGKGSNKKNKTGASENPEDGEKLPYVHVRARRGQATDSHSLAERARREKINARMKLLQELVPGCNKISGTALVLDEIINHVQSLQRQVEYLSMRLAAVNPRIDFNLDSLLAGSGSLMDSSYQSMVTPVNWPEIQINSERERAQQQWHVEPLTQPVWAREDHHNLITPESSLPSYDSTNSVAASLHSSQLKMEL